MYQYRKYQRPRFTNLGTPFVELINLTGAVSVKGTSVSGDGFIIPTVPYDNIGVVYESGKANGVKTKVVLSGLCEALLEDGSTSGYGGWLRLSTNQLGRVVNTTSPGGLGAILTDDHFKEVGHCLTQTTAGGINNLIKMVMHQL